MGIENFSEIIEWAVKNHWSVTKRERAEVRINDAVRQKYQEIPQEYLTFIEGLEEAVSPKDTTWFLCESDYNMDTVQIST